MSAAFRPGVLLADKSRTSNPHITWVPQVLATALLGMGSVSSPPLWKPVLSIKEPSPSHSCRFQFNHQR